MSAEGVEESLPTLCSPMRSPEEGNRLSSNRPFLESLDCANVQIFLRLGGGWPSTRSIYQMGREF